MAYKITKHLNKEEKDTSDTQVIKADKWLNTIQNYGHHWKKWNLMKWK